MPAAVRRPAALGVAAIAVLIAALAGMAAIGGLTPVAPESPEARGIAAVFWLLVGVSALIVLVVFGPLAYFIVRFRGGGRGREAEGPQIRGNTRLEVGWTIGAGLIVVAIIVFVFYKLPGITDPAAAGGEPLRIHVEGRQFYWLYEYPEGVTAIDTLRLPVGRTVEFAITAPTGDVIHSFWVPALHGKRDAIPGQETTFRATPERIGTYRVICGEFCGIQHTAMRGEVRVLAAADFDEWLAAQRREPDLGGQIWAGVCQKCHNPEIRIGPELVGNPLLANREALTQIVTHGRRAMPAVGQGWSEEQLDALLDFAEQLGGGGGG